VTKGEERVWDSVAAVIMATNRHAGYTRSRREENRVPRSLGMAAKEKLRGTLVS